MQNLPITATPPVTSIQPPASADNNSTAQATEPFGNVLARQRANASASQNSAQPGNKQGASSPSSKDASPATIGKDATDGVQVPVPDTTNAVSGDMLAALLPAVTATDKSAANDKPDPKVDQQASSPDSVSTLPGDMLAMLLPAAKVGGTNNVGKTDAAANKKDIREIAPGAGKETQAPQAAAVMVGEIRQAVVSGKSRQSAESKVAPEPLGASGELKPAQPRVQGGKPENVSAVNAGKEKAFASALEASAKDGAKAAQLDATLVKTHMQQDVPTAMDGVSRNNVMSVAVSQNGVAQVAQAAINTPVTHEAWGDEFNQKITWMATQHEQTAALHLNPPNLGPLDVVLKVSGDQATALFTSPHAAVRDAVEQALPRLRDMMADNGITLGNAMVSDQSPKDQQAWQAGTQQRGGGSSRGSDAGVSIGTVSSGDVAVQGRRHNGMVDTFV